MKKISFKESRRNFLKTGLVALVNLAIPISFIGCASYGKIKRDDNVLMPYFESGTMVQGNEYRQSPCGSNPEAILSFPKGSLDSNLWDCSVLNSEELKTKTLKIQENASQSEEGVGGAYILDDKGKRIGQIYGSDSYLNGNPTIWLKNGNKFSIETPGMKSEGGWLNWKV